MPQNRRSILSTPTFWTVYLLGVYQHEYTDCADPDTIITHDSLPGAAMLGGAFSFTVSNPLTAAARGTALVFEEPCADVARTGIYYIAADNSFRINPQPALRDEVDAEAVAHEVAHLLGAEHEDGGLMGGKHMSGAIIPFPPGIIPTGEKPEFTGIVLHKIYTLRPEGP